MIDPTPPCDSRLTELFVRYWDNTLTDDEAAELDNLLATDPAAREWFRTLCLQAVTATELVTVHNFAVSQGTIDTVETEPIPVPTPPKRSSRRRFLRYVGGGIAASVAAVGGWKIWGDSPAQARMITVRGDVKIATSTGVTAARSGAVIPTGATIFTHGMNSAVALTCPDGTGVSLAGDSTLIVSDAGRKILLVRGHATADILPRKEIAPIEFSTAVAMITAPSGALLMLGHAARATEVVVEDGAVNVFDPKAAKLAVVGAGEMLTVESGGRKHKQTTPVTPDDYAFPMGQPLPEDWHVGKRLVTPDGPVLVPEWWYDPYHSTEMWQIRSDKQWARGFFRLFPESTFHVKYWVDRPGRGQVIACVRAARLPDADTAVVECNDAFENARPKEWQWLHVKVSDMLDNIHGPKFAAPWVGFLLIVNTYKADLGLKIAEYRVTHPGAEWPAG